jgi:hypothetical protein
VNWVGHVANFDMINATAIVPKPRTSKIASGKLLNSLNANLLARRDTNRWRCIGATGLSGEDGLKRYVWSIDATSYLTDDFDFGCRLATPDIGPMSEMLWSRR